METVGENDDYQLGQVKKSITMEHNQLENTKSRIEALAEKMENAMVYMNVTFPEQNFLHYQLAQYISGFQSLI